MIHLFWIVRLRFANRKIGRSQVCRPYSISILISATRRAAGLQHPVICPTGKSVAARENLSIPSRKNISLVPSGKSPPLVFAVPHPKEGRTRNRHGRWVRDAMDVLVSQGERCECGRRSRVVLTPRRWRQVS